MDLRDDPRRARRMMRRRGIPLSSREARRMLHMTGIRANARRNLSAVLQTARWYVNIAAAGPTPFAREGGDTRIGANEAAANAYDAAWANTLSGEAAHKAHCEVFEQIMAPTFARNAQAIKLALHACSTRQQYFS